MIEALIALLIVIIVVGIIGAIIVYIIGMIPMDARFRQIAAVLVWVIMGLIILVRALPLLGVSI